MTLQFVIERDTGSYLFSSPSKDLEFPLIIYQSGVYLGTISRLGCDVSEYRWLAVASHADYGELDRELMSEFGDADSALIWLCEMAAIGGAA